MSTLPVPIAESTPPAFREFCAAAATVMAEQVFEKAANEDASLTSKMEAAKWFAKMADYEPKANISANAGAGFSIIINLPGATPHTMSTGVVLDAERVGLLEDPPAHVQLRPTHNYQFISHDSDDA